MERNNKMKQVNLAKAITKNKKCIGYVWKVGKNLYEYQNDNDLGLDLECIDMPMTYNKKVYVGNGYYFYVMRGNWEYENANGVSLSMATLLLKECHKYLFDFTKQELKKLEQYWGQF